MNISTSKSKILEKLKDAESSFNFVKYYIVATRLQLETSTSEEFIIPIMQIGGLSTHANQLANIASEIERLVVDIALAQQTPD